MKHWTLSILLSIIIVPLFAQTKGELSVSVSTSSAGGNYSPRNIVAIWVEDSDGNYVKTLLAYADKRITHLNNWETSSNSKGVKYNVVDAVTGATRGTHATRTCTWDGTDYNKNLVADGTYSLCMELTDKNSTGNYSNFSFEKGESNTVTPANVSSFSSISIDWAASTTGNLFEFNDTELVEVFPNPVKNEFHVKGKNISEIEVWSISGKFILRNNFSNDIDLSSHENGIYLVKVKTGDQTIIKKLIKN